MSVETARQAVLVEAMGEDVSPTFDAAVDRLILEAQAEMPCVWKWQASPETDVGCVVLKLINPAAPELCPSCTARAKLKELARAISENSNVFAAEVKA